MSEKRKLLLLAALKQAGRPLASDELLDEATGLAMANNWPPQLTMLDRRSVAALCLSMKRDGLLAEAGVGVDARAGRTTPKYVPTDGYDAHAPVPAPPADMSSARSTGYDQMSRSQLLAVLEAQDAYLEAAGRFLADMTHVRDKARRILQNAGVEMP